MQFPAEFEQNITKVGFAGVKEVSYDLFGRDAFAALGRHFARWADEMAMHRFDRVVAAVVAEEFGRLLCNELAVDVSITGIVGIHGSSISQRCLVY